MNLLVLSAVSAAFAGSPDVDSEPHLTVSFRPMAAVFGRADVQAEIRLTRQLAVVAHGLAGSPPAGWSTGRSESDPVRLEEVRRLGAGVGTRYFLDDFERGTFIGLDVDLIHTLYAPELSVYRAVMMPKTGCKYSTASGLTFGLDLGVGAVAGLTPTAMPTAVVFPVVQAGAHVGWTF